MVQKNKDTEDLYCQDLIWDIECRYSPVHYSKKWKEYSLSNFEFTPNTSMTFCHHCGKKLPKSLRDTWFDILQSEYGIKATLATPYHEIPKEFHTDEWWKKRGL